MKSETPIPAPIKTKDQRIAGEAKEISSAECFDDSAHLVDLLAKTAQHGVDPGPTFNCRLPIFAYGKPQSLDEETKEIRQLEFGRAGVFREQRSRPRARPGAL